jgi:hypothetical protein
MATTTQSQMLGTAFDFGDDLSADITSGAELGAGALINAMAQEIDTDPYAIGQNLGEGAPSMMMTAFEQEVETDPYAIGQSF